jgi:hypothetical protein
MSTTTSRRPTTGETIRDLFDRGMRIRGELMDAVGTVRSSAVGDVFERMTPRVGRTTACCEIPPPCWLPKDLGEVRSHVCPGGSATLRIRVTNCGVDARGVDLTAEPKAAGVKIAPAKLALGRMERGVAVATLAVAAEAKPGEEHEALVWVQGCHDHFVRWTVSVASRGADSCHEIDVEDCPDLVHHWYDHFYCQRPCFHGRDR